MKTKMVIDKDGNFVAVYNDCIQHLTEALDMRVSRVSDVVYDHSEKVWKAIRKDGKLLATDKNRKKCVEKEVDELNKDLTSLFNVHSHDYGSAWQEICRRLRRPLSKEERMYLENNK